MTAQTIFRRIPAALLDQMIAEADEEKAAAYLRQGFKWFPYSIQHFHTYGELHRILDPSYNPESVFYHVEEGASPIQPDPEIPFDQIYIGQVRYLSPQLVREIAAEMVKIDFETLLKHLQLVLEIPVLEIPFEDLRPVLRHPETDKLYHLLEKALCFFQIAAENGEGILRSYVD